MKKACFVCGGEFEARDPRAKNCSACRAAKRWRCIRCGAVFSAKHQATLCSSCRKDDYHRNKPPRARVVEKKVVQEDIPVPKQKPPHDPQHIADMAREARELGLSYGQYSALRRGLLRV